MRPRIVGVIFSRADLRRAVRMRKPPDFFELRLDTLAPFLAELHRAARQLRAPLIITARHPAEGGANQLSSARRRALLLEFLPHAHYLDVELRSLPAFRSLLEKARRNQTRTILSFHDFQRCPTAAQLDRIAARAHSLGADLLKVAVRTDTAAQAERLLDFFDRHKQESAIAAMGIGKLGASTRTELARRGSALNYGHLGVARVAGQTSVDELRRRLSRRRSPTIRDRSCKLR